MSDYQVEFNAAKAMAQLHGESAARLYASAQSLPDDVDGGPGSEAMLIMLAQLIAGGDSLLNLHSFTEQLLNVTVDLYRGVEESAAEIFDQLAREIP